MRRLRLGTIAVLAGLVFPLLHPGSNLARAEQRPLYQVRQLGSLGGTASAGNGINDRAWVVGASNLAGDQTTHATLWRDGTTVDLGTLGGPNSAVLWPVKNNSGLIVGVAETAETDPLGEAWSCSFFFPSATGHTCLGFVWQDGRMRPLPTLGGNNGFATGVNNLGQVVGWAENTVHDATCNAPQVLQFRAVLWDIRTGLVRELPPLPGDQVSAATAINDRGQVVGISGTCDKAVGRFSAAHAVLWNNGTPVDMGDLGGEAWNTPMAINHRGEVVGFANLPDGAPGAFNAHAFLWTEADGMQDLGTLPGDAISQALGINGRGQVVGLSCGGSGCRAFLWEDGVMADLNTLVTPGYEGHLVFANDVNDQGAISGQAIDPGTGDAVAFLAAPLGENR
jgi:probable HAF family extracellular repeat protein